MLKAGVRAEGGSPDVVGRYPSLCEAAGLRVLSRRGTFFVPDDPSDLLAISRSFLQSIRAAAIDHGLATADEIAALDRELDAAGATPPRSAVGGLFVVLIAERP